MQRDGSHEKVANVGKGADFLPLQRLYRMERGTAAYPAVGELDWSPGTPPPPKDQPSGQAPKTEEEGRPDSPKRRT